MILEETYECPKTHFVLLFIYIIFSLDIENQYGRIHSINYL